MDNAYTVVEFLFGYVFPLFLNTLYSHWLLSLVVIMVLFTFVSNLYVMLRGVK